MSFSLPTHNYSTPIMSFQLPNFLLDAARVPVLAIGIPLGLGLLSGYPTAQVVRSGWYQNLRVPPGRPPRQVFPIVWPLLYISMGYASHLAVKALDVAVSPSVRSDLMLALGLYHAQLSLNLLWSPLFFGVKQIGPALVDSAAMAGTTYYMTSLLYPIVPQAAYLLLPYCSWLTFATYLNGGIWWLNGRKGSEKQQ
ncbi:TspO/MBR family-domain-containing protein [Roridomyces roridus]|uniref:TspO/MBR family-domain-containing protein n=1 Tax=Roridomyces roridus TaxID=1738132 RepID=A0AAD7C4V1_9AGAR|nr:TspO/MBR family-domain-containing protein [Roridomyces roridus]